MCHKAERIIRNRLKLEACKMMGDKLSTVGIYVMKIKAKEKKSAMLARVRKISIPFQWLWILQKKKKKGKKKPGCVLCKKYAQTSIIILAQTE